MKCLFIASFRYPFMHAIRAGMEKNDIEVKSIDYQDLLNKREAFLTGKFNAMPRKVKLLWEKPLTSRVNQAYIDTFRAFQPDLVFVYNSQLLVPETVNIFRESAKVAFMLGDNPLYTLSSNLYNLTILNQADYIISPDTFWKDQLNMMGIRNIHFDCFGFDDTIYRPMEVTPDQLAEYGSDFIFVGNSSKSNWGYKRYLFLNIFKDFDTRIYLSGRGQDRWLPNFSGLEKKVLAHDRYDPAFNNLVYNCSKIAPIELVPSLFNGVHVRVFDALGSGILPMCEYSKDLETLFEGIDIPLIRNYNEGVDVARYWLEQEDHRLETISLMRERVTAHYAPEKVIGRMCRRMFGTVPQNAEV